MPFFSSHLYNPSRRPSRWISLCSAILALLLASGANADLNNITSPTFQFRSRPDLHAPMINLAILQPDRIVPGYIMLAPYRNVDPGPYIYDNWGNLVWSGAGSSGPKTAHAPRVCQFRGEDHLCYFQGEQHQGFARGHGVIMDKNYRMVKTVESSGAGASADMHEFKITPFSNGTTALMTVYQPRQYELSVNPRFNVGKGMGWIVEGVFQEVDIETGKVVFEWRSLDHVDPGLSWTMPGSTDTSGDGLHEQTPWDYFHINSVDKNEDGEFLISARHVSAIYKLSGVDGHIMWQLGGTIPNDQTRYPTIQPVDFTFSYQHHARWVSENDTHTIMSFYDNGSNNYNRTGEFSHGWIVAIDHITQTAWKLKEWTAPENAGGLSSGSQGNMQLLPGGGVHIGWGEHAYFSEHTEDGEAVMYGQIADRASNVMIYRSNKYNWTAQPLTKPALWTYSRLGEGNMTFFVSWNGATEVASWNFYTAHTSKGPWSFVGNAKRTGFETTFFLNDADEFAYAEAVDASGSIMESSVIARTFTPSPELVAYCDDNGCAKAEKTSEEEAVPYEADIIVSDPWLSPNRGFNTANYYATEYTPALVAAASSLGRGLFSLFLLGLGLLGGVCLAAVAFAIFHRGRANPAEPWSERIQRGTIGIANCVTKGAFGNKWLGKYSMIDNQEVDASAMRIVAKPTIQRDATETIYWVELGDVLRIAAWWGSHFHARIPMAHRRQKSSRTLRNRHGSDTVGLHDFDPPRRSLTAPTTFEEEDDELPSRTPSPGNPPWSPASLENGHARRPEFPPRTTSAQYLQPLPSPRLSLPPGASTPSFEPTASPIAKASPTWTNMPHKGQLAILATSRFVDFFQMAALQTYMVHQLKSFDPEAPDFVISHQAGVLQGAFTAAQIITSILWGRAADQPHIGRKTVLNIGLIGTAFGCIGVGFSRTYGQAVFWRLMSGAINGTVGSARTMVAERTPQPWHPRAFLLLPAAFNVANVAGPILAGVLADPVTTFPTIFGPGSPFGGTEGVRWMKVFPYALPNLLSAFLLLAEAALVHYSLEETLKGKRPLKLADLDPVQFVHKTYQQIITAKNSGFRVLQETQRQGLLSGEERSGESIELDRIASREDSKSDSRPVLRLPFRRIWTSNVLWTLLSIAIFDFHMGAFANLWILFLATPREFFPDKTRRDDPPIIQRSAFKFSSGLAFPPPTIGFAMAIIGFIGVALQFLLYPWANSRFGLMACFRGSLFLFPLAYLLAPYLALLPSSTAPPDPASGFFVWFGISFVVLLQVAARTFALPASIILLNNSSPHPSVLATIHGVGQACSASFRTLGPILAGYWYGVWTERGVVGMAWWMVASVAALGCVAAFWVRNGSGHEIFLPGEEVEMKEESVGVGRSGDGR
ncbi:MFS general substrate transporter [Acrodontium crateriforme]|uniref:MFS general substrate transporter n=1 Tax=Acrodontium crateriforme TaxID=150365 RepID=A0AAQ3M228_9PEZI|nr:MFS general substrate transporter [Acrodontium crateriforme]